MKTLDNEFTEFLTSIAKTFGLDDLSLKVFACLYIEPEEIPMDEIAKKTGYSLASISNTMKLLETMGAVKRMKKPGDRKVYFFMGKDLVRWNIMKIDFAMNSMVRPAKEHLPGIIKKYTAKAKTKRDQKKIEIVKGYRDQVMMFETLLKKWKNDLKKVQK